MLRDAGDLLVPAVTATIAALKLTPADAGAVKLAQRYAIAIDADGDLEKLGPKLLAALESLGATPAARARLKEGGTGAKPAGLHALRQAHGA
jgi:hypothetical protein